MVIRRFLCFQTCYEQLQAATSLEAKHSIFLELSKLLSGAFELLKGKQSMHFTALGILNRIIDMCIVHRNYETGSVARGTEASTPTTVFSASSHFSPSSASSAAAAGAGSAGGVGGGGVGGAPDTRPGAAPKRKDRDKATMPSDSGGVGEAAHSYPYTKLHGRLEGGGVGEDAPAHPQQPLLQRTQSSCLGRIPSLGRRRTSVAVSHNDAQGDGHKGEEESSDGGKGGASGYVNGVGSVCVNRTPLEILLCIDPGQIMSVLHNSITMHKRIIGTRQKCTPGVRWRHCTHHCLQILSARVLTVMCHSVHVQHKIVSAGHLKPLVEALDPNHDPVSCPCLSFWLGSWFSVTVLGLTGPIVGFWVLGFLVLRCIDGPKAP